MEQIVSNINFFQINKKYIKEMRNVIHLFKYLFKIFNNILLLIYI